jgi:hypothetical protein
VRDILQEFGFTAHIREGVEEAQALKGSGIPGTVVGGRGDSQRDEPVSSDSDPLRKEV